MALQLRICLEMLCALRLQGGKWAGKTSGREPLQLHCTCCGPVQKVQAAMSTSVRGSKILLGKSLTCRLCRVTGDVADKRKVTMLSSRSIARNTPELARRCNNVANAAWQRALQVQEQQAKVAALPKELYDALLSKVHWCGQQAPARPCRGIHPAA